MRTIGLERFFARVSADKKGATPTRGVKHFSVGRLDTKTIDEVDHFHASVVLAELVTFFRADQTLKDRADYFIVKLRKIEFMNLLNKGAPTLNSGVSIEWEAIGDGKRIFAKNGFIVAGYIARIFKITLKTLAQIVPGGHLGGRLEGI